MKRKQKLREEFQMQELIFLSEESETKVRSGKKNLSEKAIKVVQLNVT